MSTARATWKACERRIARMLGGVRVPVTGRARGDAPDIAHPLWSIEVKLRTNRPAFLEHAMSQAKAAARGEQVPLVVVAAKSRDTRQAFVVMELGDFANYFGGGPGKDTTPQDGAEGDGT